MTETNNLRDVGYSHDVPITDTVELDDPRLARITRIRYLGDSWAGPFDLSYAHGELTTGERVRVRGLPDQVHGRGQAAIRRDIYRAGDAAGVRMNRLCGGHVDDVLSVLA